VSVSPHSRQRKRHVPSPDKSGGRDRVSIYPYRHPVESSPPPRLCFARSHTSNCLVPLLCYLLFAVLKRETMADTNSADDLFDSLQKLIDFVRGEPQNAQMFDGGVIADSTLVCLSLLIYFRSLTGIVGNNYFRPPSHHGAGDCSSRCRHQG